MIFYVCLVIIILGCLLLVGQAGPRGPEKFQLGSYDPNLYISEIVRGV
jgi:hypothetical protein